MLKEYRNYILIVAVALAFLVGYKVVLGLLTAVLGLFAISQEREFRKVEKEIDAFDKKRQSLKEDSIEKVKEEELRTKEEIDEWLDQ